ncbi:MAG: SpoIIE family protein phosphatase [Bacteroidia bacterium]|nr:SpoIIE family protein phosphatase [Bacteroidia bacterium]
MAFRFTIGRKIGTGFGVLLVLTLVAFIFTIVIVTKSKHSTESVVGQVTPSVSALKEYNFILQKSQTLISRWYFKQSGDDDPSKTELINLINKDYPHIKSEINTLSENWTKQEKDKAKTIINFSDGLFKLYQEEIMTPLNSWESYDDANIYFLVTSPFEDSQEKIKMLYVQLNDLITQKELNAEKTKEQMFSSFNFLDRFVKLLGIGLFIGGILIAIFTTTSITKPIQVLKKMLLSMGLGILPKDRITYRTDEIGEMGIALNSLVESMESTTEFAKQTGAGNFEADYKPLSKDDRLGLALLKMRDDLSENEKVLEQKVIARTEEVVRQRQIVEEKHKEITDSINYAERIQRSFLATREILDENLRDYFVFFKPKDIVSGDFYFAHKLNNDNFLLATADSTGHGVPGAIMSLLNITSLEKAIENQVQPSDILNTTRKIIIDRLKNDGSDEGGKDGMDCSIICFDFKNRSIIVSAANNPVWIVRGLETIEIKPDKMPVGKHDKQDLSFTQQKIDIQKGDVIYTLTDGFSDQFGGSLGKKFMSKKLRELLAKNANLPMDEQKTILESTFNSWVGDLEQIDDVTLIGIRV